MPFRPLVSPITSHMLSMYKCAVKDALDPSYDDAAEKKTILPRHHGLGAFHFNGPATRPKPTPLLCGWYPGFAARGRHCRIA